MPERVLQARAGLHDTEAEPLATLEKNCTLTQVHRTACTLALGIMHALRKSLASIFRLHVLLTGGRASTCSF